MHTIFIYERSPGRLILSFVKSDYVRDNAALYLFNDHPYHNLLHPQFIRDCLNCEMKPLTTMVSNHAIPKEQ